MPERKMKLDRAKRTSKPKTNLSAAHAKRPNTTETRAQTSQNRTAKKNCLTLLSDALKKDEPRPRKTHLQTKNQPLGSPCETAKHHLDTSPNQPKPHRKKKLPNAAFWCPKERWTSTVQNAPPNQKPTSRQPMRNSQTPPRHEPKPAKTAPQKNCLTLLSDALKKDEPRPCKTLPNQKPTSRQPMRNSQTPPRHEPKPAKTAPQKKLPNAAVWCPKERWNSTVQNARQPMRNSQTPPRHEPKPAKTAPQKNCLTLLSDALKKDETRPCKTHLQTKNQPLGSPCETAKHHLDTSPNQPKPHRKKTA